MSKVDIAKTLTKAAQQLLKGAGAKAEGVSLTKMAGETLGGLASGTKTVLGESFVKSTKTILTAGPTTPTSQAWLAVTGGALVNGGLIAYNSVNAMEDTRRLGNMSANLSDFYTPYEDANNVLKMSAGAATLGLVPAAAGAMEIVGENLGKVSSSTGLTGKLAKAMGATGKLGNGLINSVFGTIGKLTGSKVLGKHYVWIAGLTAARAAYKTFKIDMVKDPNSTIASLNIGGKSLFVDNDPNSPTFRQSIFLKQAIAKRTKENLQRSMFGNMADGITGGAQAAYKLIG